MKNLKPLLNTLIAHRGFHNSYIKENSKLSIELACKKKLAIEIDITLTSDKKIVICHDSYIKHNKRKIYISDTTLQKLIKYDDFIITLDEVLNIVKGKVPLLIELKPYNKGNELEKYTVRLLDNYKGYFAIQSFSPKCIYWFKKNRNEFIRGQLITNNYRYNFITNIIYNHMLFNIFTKPDFISYNIKGLPNKQIKKSRKKIPVLGWTVRTMKELEINKMYCDNFICENIFER